jgi:cytochrome c5
MIKKVLLGVALVGMSSVALADGAMAKFQKTCNVCHASGAAGAPKTGAKADWDARLAAAGSMDALVSSVVNGKGGMPPKGLCYDCSTDDYKAMIQHMMGGQ